MESILNSIKGLLGVDSSYTAFDADIIAHINSVFMILTQLGVGPSTGYSIADASSKWSDFLGINSNLVAVRTYTYLRVKMLFDPPTVSAVLDAQDRIIKELEWRLNAVAEG